MSKRLQVVMDERDLRDVQQAARAHRMTVAEWVRQVLKVACATQPRYDSKQKLAALQAAMKHEFPAPEIGQMLKEIERGYTIDLG